MKGGIFGVLIFYLLVGLTSVHSLMLYLLDIPPTILQVEPLPPYFQYKGWHMPLMAPLLEVLHFKYPYLCLLVKNYSVKGLTLLLMVANQLFLYTL